MTIKSFASGLSGKLQSGDIVSVIAADYKKQGATVIPAELKYVEVISVTASSGYEDVYKRQHLHPLRMSVFGSLSRKRRCE